MKKRFVLALACGSALVAAATSAQAGETRALRAAITFNIIRYVGFPEAGGNQPISLCLIRAGTSIGELLSLNGQRIGNRPITVRATGADATSGCDVVYVAQAEDIARVSRRGVLVMGDGASIVGAGGSVGLVRMGGQIRFEVNNRAARNSGLVISSRLLRLAARVQQ